MLFNSFHFAVFLPVVFVLYWFIANKNLKAQNFLLLLSSYVFYGWWDLRFLFLLLLLTASNYLIGIAIENNHENRKAKLWFMSGLLINLSGLVVFKYFNFFIDGFIDLVSLFGYNLPRSTTKIILPVGISFYTFLSLSYVIDIYKKTISAERNAVNVLLSLSFFPIILAGPIQRPSLLLPSISEKREFDYNLTADGLRQILWGMFTKVVIADNLATFADDFFKNYSAYSGSTLLLGVIFYSVQIYADFSGYSDMAIGTGKLFGFSLMRNFAYPYFSRDIAEFWKRWHMSLTTWFRDYIFLPLSFSLSWKIQGEKVFLITKDFFIYIMASAVTWFLTGLWHGANYTFVIWGMIHGLFLILYKWHIKPRKRIFKKYGIDNRNISIVIAEISVTMAIVMIAWIFFRAENIENAVEYISGIFSTSLFSVPQFPRMKHAIIISILAFIFFLLEWKGREQQFPLAYFSFSYRRPMRWLIYCTLIACIFLFSGEEQQFIYFQF